MRSGTALSGCHSDKAPMKRSAALSHGKVEWLEAGSTRVGSCPPIVLLHGIGSCADSWVGLIRRLADGGRVLAWDAPGYGGSTPLQVDQPLASDYAATAAEWLDAAKVLNPILVGHSLGALMAAALVARESSAASRASGMVLVSPAQGYGTADPRVRREKFESRVQALRALGAVRMSIERAASLCSPSASAVAVAKVQELMSRVTEPGYSQAAWMLSNDMISRYLGRVRVHTAVMCGALDAVVEPESARELADKYNMPFHMLNAVGHASYIENIDEFQRALRTMIGVITRGAHARNVRVPCA
jgi:pimeloyl-ACP methyl ester carboxylesterase